jgi:choline dehydrogenase
MHYLPVGSDQVNYDRAIFMPKGHAFVLIPTLLYPKSRGEITLAGPEPERSPHIDPRYFHDDADMRTLIQGVRLAQQVIRSQKLDACRGRALSPLVDAEDEAVLRQEIKRRCSTLFHPVGTCAMGQGPEAVVDASLKVHGVEGLRVADASIMPTIVGGNTNAPAIMIAEKASDLVLGLSLDQSRRSSSTPNISAP